PAADENDGVQGEAVFLQHRGADEVGNLSRCPAVTAVNLVDQYKALPVVVLHGKRGPEAGCKQWMALAGRGLDILRMMVATPDDDQVVDASDDVELIFMDEAQIARPQIGAL